MNGWALAQGWGRAGARRAARPPSASLTGIGVEQWSLAEHPGTVTSRILGQSMGRAAAPWVVSPGRTFDDALPDYPPRHADDQAWWDAWWDTTGRRCAPNLLGFPPLPATGDKATDLRTLRGRWRTCDAPPIGPRRTWADVTFPYVALPEAFRIDPQYTSYQEVVPGPGGEVLGTLSASVALAWQFLKDNIDLVEWSGCLMSPLLGECLKHRILGTVSQIVGQQNILVWIRDCEGRTDERGHLGLAAGAVDNYPVFGYWQNQYPCVIVWCVTAGPGSRWVDGETSRAALHGRDFVSAAVSRSVNGNFDFAYRNYWSATWAELPTDITQMDLLVDLATILLHELTHCCQTESHYADIGYGGPQASDDWGYCDGSYMITSAFAWALEQRYELYSMLGPDDLFQTPPYAREREWYGRNSPSRGGWLFLADDAAWGQRFGYGASES